MTTATLQFIDDKITEKNSLLEELDQLDREIKAAQEIEFDLTTALNSLSSIFNRANPLILDEVKKAIAVKCSELGILNGEVKEEVKKTRTRKKKDNLTTSLDKIDELIDKSKTTTLSPEEVKEFNQSVEVAAEQLSEELPISQVEEFKNNLITELENKNVVEVEVLEKNKTSKLSPEELNEFGRSLDTVLEQIDNKYTQQELEDSAQAIADIDVQAQVVETIEETKPAVFSMASFFSQPIQVSEAAIAMDDMETGTEVQHTLTGVVGVIDRSVSIGTLPVQMEGIRSGLVPVVFAGGKSVIPISELEVLPVGSKVKHRSGAIGEVCDPSEIPSKTVKNSPKSIIPIKFMDDVLPNWYSWQEPIHLTPMTEEEVEAYLEQERQKLEEIAKGDPF
ncbi:hypothetical protein NIES25_52280 [Nostoc linckia NIES-25]|nr:hypothetical protein NIES25_52280 [Nostoc linckia NIES-25]